MYLLEEAVGGNRSAALEHVRKVVRSAYDFDHDPAVLRTARQALGAAIVAALHGPAALGGEHHHVLHILYCRASIKTMYTTQMC